jgi:hypothetical protein
MGNNFIVAAVQGFLQFIKGGVLGKKQYCLWLWEKDRWRNLNPAGNSSRRCREALRLILGQNPGQSVQYLILPKNFSPPERKAWDGGQ